MPEVPLHKLDEGIRLCKKHVEQLIDSADVLVQNDRFVSSLPFSILAMEHYGYLLMLQQYKDENKSITKTQWEKRITHHPTKLKFAYETDHPEYRTNRMRIWNLVEVPEEIFSGLTLDYNFHRIVTTGIISELKLPQDFTLSSSNVQKTHNPTFRPYLKNAKIPDIVNLQLDFDLKNYEKLKADESKPKEQDLKRLISFDFIKQDVFYLNYLDDWFSIHEKLHKSEQKAMAIIFLISIKYDFWTHQLSTFYPHLDTRRRHSIKRHPIYQKMISLEKQVDLEEFKKYRKIVKEVVLKHYEIRAKQKNSTA